MTQLEQQYLSRQTGMREAMMKLQVKCETLEGKYEASQDLMQSLKAMQNDTVQESAKALRHVLEERGGGVINRGQINMADIRKANDNFTSLMEGNAK